MKDTKDTQTIDFIGSLEIVEANQFDNYRKAVGNVFEELVGTIPEEAHSTDWRGCFLNAITPQEAVKMFYESKLPVSIT